jgi:hypothetical protein
MNVVELPVASIGDISGGLRRLADDIDRGLYGDPYSVLWVIDCGGGRLEVGQLGLMQSPGAESYFLLGLAMRKLESVLA